MCSTVLGTIPKNICPKFIKICSRSYHDDVCPQYGKSSHVWDGFPYTRRLLIHGNASDVWEDCLSCVGGLSIYGQTSHILGRLPICVKARKLLLSMLKCETWRLHRGAAPEIGDAEADAKPQKVPDM